MSDFYRELERRELAERSARIMSKRPENLHDYQGCVADLDREREAERVFGACGGKCGEEPCVEWNKRHRRLRRETEE